MNDIIKKISNIGIVPVIKIDDPEKAVPLAKALCNGGLPVVLHIRGYTVLMNGVCAW